jgi:hypothetical protein
MPIYSTQIFIPCQENPAHFLEAFTYTAIQFQKRRMLMDLQQPVWADLDDMIFAECDKSVSER